MLTCLLRIGLCMLLIIMVPLAATEGPLSAVAWADDDDGDDNGDDDGDDDDRDDNDASERNGAGDGDNRAPATSNTGRRLRDLLFGRPPAPTPPVQRRAAPQPLPTRAEAEVVVLDLSPEDLATLIANGYQVISVANLATLNSTVRRLRVPPGTSLDAALEDIRQLPTGQASDFNHFYRMSEGDTPVCTGLHCAAFDLVKWTSHTAAAGSCGHAAVPIGLIDTDINPEHEALVDSRLTVLDFDADRNAASGRQHGTAVAALIVGSRQGRAQGLLPDAELIAIDAFATVGQDERSDVFTLVQAMDRLAAAGVRVINMSLAGPHNLLLERMVDEVSGAQILVVSAAGNDGPHAAPAFPGAYDPVLTATAIDASGRVFRRAGRGPHIDLAAPGVEVWTAASVRGFRSKTGTSFATPFVTAAAAVLMSAKPEMDIAKVKSFLRATALDLGDEGPDDVFGAGLVQFAPICAGSPQTTPALLD